MISVAAVLTQTGSPLELIELEIPKLKKGQVLVEIKFSGVCHTQVSECRGHRGHDAYVPHCLGHEGTGIVLECGPEVRKVKKGDAVLMSWMKGSGADVPGTVYNSNLGPVNAGGITTFSQHSVVSENRLTVLPEGIPIREGALLGCAIPTGMGAVFNTAEAKEGQSLVVFGAGGVGLCAIAGASLAGCSQIVAVDLLDSKLKAAKNLGATDCVNASQSDALDTLKELMKEGFDIAIEATGKSPVMQQALASVHKQGGIAVVLGNATFGEKLEIDPREFNAGKQLRGSWGGDNIPDRDFPLYFELVQSGRLKLESLADSSYQLGDINQAIDDLEFGRTIRPLIEMASE